MIVAKGICPKCGAWWSVEEARKHTRVDGSITLWEATKSGDGIRCRSCWKLHTKESLEGRSSKPYKRKDQIRLLNADGAVEFVFYRLTHGVRRELSQQGKKLSAGFKGDGIALAAHLGMDADDLAQEVGLTVEDLGDTTFDIGKK